MSDVARIYRVLAEAGLEISGEVSEDPFSARAYFAFVPVWRDKRNRQIPSNSLLSSVVGRLQEEGVKLRFLLTDKFGGDIEAGLRATLLHEFGADLRNVFLTVSKSAAHIWLDQKRDISEQQRTEIRGQAGRFLETFGIDVQSIQSLTSSRVPSMSVVLRLIRRHAPISEQGLTEVIRERGFELPSVNWLTRKLDSLRKGGDIVRMEDQSYALTMSGIARLGSSKSAQSPDVSRMLALASGRK